MGLLDKVKHAANSAHGHIQDGYNGSAGKMMNLESECQRAAKTLSHFVATAGTSGAAYNAIPPQVLKSAMGLAVFTTAKAGFIWAGSLGTGLVIARISEDRWSAPSCIGCGGASFGLQIGADVTECVCVLTTAEAVSAFSKGGNVKFGGNIQATAGPVGTGGAVESALLNPSPVYTYARSQGFFGGVSLDGQVLLERADANHAHYGEKVSASDILAGKIPPPACADQIYELLHRAETNPGYVPPPATYAESRFGNNNGQQQPPRTYAESRFGNNNGLQQQQQQQPPPPPQTQAEPNSGVNTVQQP